MRQRWVRGSAPHEASGSETERGRHRQAHRSQLGSTSPAAGAIPISRQRLCAPGRRPSPRKSRRPRGRAPGAVGRVIPIETSIGVRWPRVRNARARIASDYYERGEILDRVVDALISEILHSA